MELHHDMNGSLEPRANVLDSLLRHRFVAFCARILENYHLLVLADVDTGGWSPKLTVCSVSKVKKDQLSCPA